MCKTQFSLSSVMSLPSNDPLRMRSGIDFRKLNSMDSIISYNVAKTILFWLICVYAVTMTGFRGIFVTFSASSSFVLIQQWMNYHPC